MVLSSIVLSIIVGMFVVRTAHANPTFGEYAGLSFPLGLFTQTVLMILIDCCNIPVTPFSLLCADIIILCALGFRLYKKGVRPDGCRLFWRNTIGQVKTINLVWLLLMGFIVWFEYLNMERCLFFPTYDRDSLAGFDTIGYVVSQEHTFKNLSLFDTAYMPDIKQAGSYIAYAPFVQLAYGYIYLFGAETSKLIPALLYASLLIGFYAVLARCIRKTGAALVTLLLLLTPQLLAFSSVSSTNAMHATFASLGTIYGLLWLKTRDKGDLFLSGLLLGANCWTRSEGFIFSVALGIPILIRSIRTNAYLPLAIWSVVALVPLVGWALFQRVFGLQATSILITHLFWDAEKMSLIGKYLFDHLTNTFYYGWTFLFVVVSLFINGWFLIKEKDNLTPLLVLAGSIFLYGMVLYHIDYVWDSMDNVLNHSAKRFIFCFVPIAWFYTSTNKLVASFLQRVEAWLDFSDIQPDTSPAPSGKKR